MSLRSCSHFPQVPLLLHPKCAIYTRAIHMHPCSRPITHRGSRIRRSLLRLDYIPSDHMPLYNRSKYYTNTTPTPWSGRCLLHAGPPLFPARVLAGLPLSASLRLCLQSHGPVQVVQPSGAQPSPTVRRRWGSRTFHPPPSTCSPHLERHCAITTPHWGVIGCYLWRLQGPGLRPPSPSQLMDCVRCLRHSSTGAGPLVDIRCTMRYMGHDGLTTPNRVVIYLCLLGFQGPGLRPPSPSHLMDCVHRLRLGSTGAEPRVCVRCTMRYMGHDCNTTPI